MWSSAAQDAKEASGINADLIMCFLRHEGAEPAWNTLMEVSLLYEPRFIVAVPLKGCS